MAKLSEEEKAQLAALQAKAEAPDETPEDDDDGDDGGIIVLRGRRADSFMELLTGPTRPKKATAKKAAAGKDEDQGAADDEDQGAADEDGDASPPAAHRYFRR